MGTSPSAVPVKRSAQGEGRKEEEEEKAAGSSAKRRKWEGRVAASSNMGHLLFTLCMMSQHSLTSSWYYMCVKAWVGASAHRVYGPLLTSDASQRTGTDNVENDVILSQNVYGELSIYVTCEE